MKKLILGCCLLGWGAILYAQQGTVSCGGDASGSGGSASYTIGQTDYITASGSSGTITQGIQQPFEILDGIINSKNISLECSVYPNPTASFLKLKVNNYKLENLYCKLYDQNGKLILEKKVTESETSISMDNLASANYFLKITDNEKEVNTYKIIKN